MSKLPSLEVRTSINSGVDADVLVVFQDSGKKPIAAAGGYSKLVQKLRKGDYFAAKPGSTQFVRFGGEKFAESCLLVGFGAASELTEERARVAGGHVWSKLHAEKVKTAAIRVDSILEGRGLKGELTPMRLVRAFSEGLILGAYHFTKHQAKPKGDVSHGPEKIIFLTTEKSMKDELEAEVEKVAAIGAAVNVTRDWSNEPSNIGTPEFYASEARKLSREHGLTCRVLTEKDAEREKMGLFLAVGRGAEREGRIVIVEYKPKDAKVAKNAKTIALVGKGVTFDSGGISIKPSLKMEDMKHDMTGAATVMGAMILSAAMEVPNRVIGIMAFTENMPDGDAVQPGNIITSRAGKTVEIINTDAEGRLILADVLDYAQDMKPDVVVDIATLTGAVLVALGKQCCAVLGNDEGLIETVRRAGEVNGERIWQLPLYDEYFDDMKSAYADMKNSCNDPLGGTIRGAVFLKQFIRKGVPWAHLDIAACAYDMSHINYYPKKGASGAYVRTLAQFALDF
jgi:leucyl aminopeptidase